MMIYTLVRDHKLLELRAKLESTPSSLSKRVCFLFKSHPSLLETLAQVEEQDAEAYLYLKRLAKILGMNQHAASVSETTAARLSAQIANS